jgi:acyl-CoA synthetase (AMP-forming)/AMP-acid ligase II/acyl carrier protein
VPSMLRAFLSEPGVELCRSLKRVFVSGEALSTDLQEAFFTRMGASLHNLYGPTEASIDVTSWECDQSAAGSVVRIGRPIANIRVYVVDVKKRPTPMGAPGELHLGGVGVARGYLGKPNLTAERFLPDLFGENPGERLYRTGDLTRWLPDGQLEFLGRLDDQVKIRGFRIELGEIEASLGRHPAVEAAVVAPDSRHGESQLVAYVVWRDDGVADEVDLRAHLRRTLPNYMIPSLIVSLQALPLTSNGKLDRKALPTPEIKRAELTGLYVEPQNPIQEWMAQTWAEILHLDRVGIHDNFFDLGGHSLKATQLVSRIREVFQVELPLTLLFEETNTVALLSESIEQLLIASANPDEAAAALRAVDDLTNQQMRELLRNGRVTAS